jgi:hypothetical protein
MNQIKIQNDLQKASNKESRSFASYFANHRAQLTEQILALASSKGRLCLLGAGNCLDVDLARLAENFDEVHLVDIDRDAVKFAKSRLTPLLAAKVFLHAPLDLSGLNTCISDWRDMKTTPEAFMSFPDDSSAAISRLLPGPFDAVVSCCLVSQILLTFRLALGEQHMLFQAGLITLLVTHFKVMRALINNQGRALLVTDVSSNQICSEAELNEFEKSSCIHADQLLDDLARENKLFNYLDPKLLTTLVQQDPSLSESSELSPPQKIWLWRNGPQRTFLVYTCLLAPRL